MKMARRRKAERGLGTAPAGPCDDGVDCRANASPKLWAGGKTAPADDEMEDEGGPPGSLSALPRPFDKTTGVGVRWAGRSA
jgi:hypothetical protein